MDVFSKFAACGAVAVLLAACASGPSAHPPNSALAKAQSAINSAEHAGAGQYASHALNRARNKLRSAKKVLGPDRDNTDQFGNARRLAEEATADAKYAQAQARAKQAETRAQRQKDKNNDMQAAPNAPGGAS
jgi:hypothetical protein